MMLPHSPEREQDLGARFDKALKEVVSVEAIQTFRVAPPSQCRTNVFDFEDGFRMIASRESLQDGRDVFLHISWSGSKDVLRKELPGSPPWWPHTALADVVERRLLGMGIDTSSLELKGAFLSCEKLVPHIIYKDPGPSLPKCQTSSTSSLKTDAADSTSEPS